MSTFEWSDAEREAVPCTRHCSDVREAGLRTRHTPGCEESRAETLAALVPFVSARVDAATQGQAATSSHGYTDEPPDGDEAVMIAHDWITGRYNSEFDLEGGSAEGGWVGDVEEILAVLDRRGWVVTRKPAEGFVSTPGQTGTPATTSPEPYPGWTPATRGFCPGCGITNVHGIVLRFEGGYDQFVDPINGDDLDLHVCVACYKRMVEQVEWLGRTFPPDPPVRTPGDLYSEEVFGDCFACRNLLPVMVVDQVDTTGWLGAELENCLWVRRWGALLTPLPAEPHISDAPRRVVICHACADAASGTIPMIAAVIDPDGRHRTQDTTCRLND